MKSEWGSEVGMGKRSRNGEVKSEWGSKVGMGKQSQNGEAKSEWGSEGLLSLLCSFFWE